MHQDMECLEFWDSLFDDDGKLRWKRVKVREVMNFTLHVS